MMKKIICLLFIICILMGFSTNVQAYSLDKTEEINIENERQVEGLYKYITDIKNKYEILQDLNPKEYVKNIMKTGDGKINIKNVKSLLTKYIFKEVINCSKIMAMLIVIGIISALLKNLENAFSSENVTNIAYFACYSLLIIIIVKSFKIGLSLTITTINGMVNFMNSLIPLLLVLIASVGGIAEASVMNPLIIAMLNICSKIYVDFIIPIILMSFMLMFVNNISKDYKISNLSNLFNKVALWSQGILMTIFVGVISIRGITCKTFDVVTAKTAKYAVDNFVPIVGKCLSDALSAVAGYSILLKNALSVLGLVVIISIVAFPIIKMLIIVLIYKTTAALLEPICDERIVNCVNGTGDSLTLITSTLISVSIMFFIMISILFAAGTGVLGG
ncbi:stage III sporulation protein AE [Haloimpatiens sp. FM7315]|uniref:stage III sporulation protein AE n=1 Tax=Haloimpatiens sp. FM7315 TaxID=3298609 RepID=UPI00370A3A1D